MLVLSLAYSSINFAYVWDLNITNYGNEFRLIMLSWHVVLLFPIASVSCTILQGTSSPALHTVRSLATEVLRL